MKGDERPSAIRMMQVRRAARYLEMREIKDQLGNDQRSNINHSAFQDEIDQI